MRSVMKELLPQDEARSLGYIPIDEAIKLKPANRSTYSRQAESGKIPAVQVLKGSRPVWWVLETAVGKSGALQSTKNYKQLEADWLAQMKSGAFSGTPVSESYIEGVLKWGLKRYWDILGCEASVAGLSAENFSKVMDNKALAVDEINRRDFYSTKMHIYRACTRFTDYLIQAGLKNQADRTSYKLPKRRFKPQKRMLEDEKIQEVLTFNRTWIHGRSQYDVEITDVLLHLYAFAGLRRMEPATIRISEIDFKKNVMLVYRKGGKETYVPMHLFPQLKPKLLHWLKYWRPDYKSDLLLLQDDGKPLTKSSVKDRFLRLSNALNLRKAYEKLSMEPDWECLHPKAQKEKAEALAQGMKNIARPHDLRRSFATIMANRRMPMSMLQLVLGHADLKTTQGYVLTNITDVLDWAETYGSEPVEVLKTDEIVTHDALFSLIK